MERNLEKYRRYALGVLVAVLGGVIFGQLIPVMSALLGAVTLYVLQRGQMRRLVVGHRWRRSRAAVVLLSEAVVGFVLPFALVVWLVVRELTDLAADPRPLIGQVQSVAGYVRDVFGYDLLQEDNLALLLGAVRDMGRWVLENSLDFLLNIGLLPVVLYFMLLGGDRMEDYVRRIVPFDEGQTAAVGGEMRRVIRSTALLIPLSALVQGVMAWVGFLIFGIPSAFFWGVMTAFSAMIPVAGAAIVWLPMALLLGVNGSWGMAGGLCLWGGVAVTQVDHLVRRYMEQKMTDLHPLIPIFGVLVGLSLFGFMGLIFGPLLVALFVAAADNFKRGCSLADASSVRDLPPEDPARNRNRPKKAKKRKKTAAMLASSK